MKHFFLFLLTVIFFTGSAQNQGKLEGMITDKENGESLIGVSIVFQDGTGTITDMNGFFFANLPLGAQKISISYVGYDKVDTVLNITAGVNTLILKMTYEQNTVDDIVVSGSRYGKRVSEEVISIEVIQPDLADNINAIRLDDLAKKVSGVNVADGQASIRAGSSWSYSVGSRVNIVLDGQSILTPDRSSIRWQHLPIENIGQIEVLKGASSILYGSSAMNGTIHLQTIKPKFEAENKFVSYVGVMDDYKNPIYKWWDRPRLTTGGYFSRAHKTSDKFEYVIGINTNYSELPYFEYSDYHVRANLYTKWSNKEKNHQVGFRLNYTHYKESEFVFWLADSSKALYPIDDVVFTYQNFNIDPYYIKYDKKQNRHELKGRVYFYDPSNGIRGGFLNADYQFNKEFKRGWKMVAGASQEALIAKDGAFNPPLQFGLKWSVYTQVDRSWKKISLTGGARSEFYRFNNGFGAAYGFVRNNKVSGEITEIPIPLMRMGLNYNPLKNSFLRFNIGQAFRIPSLVEYFVEYTFSGLNILSNPALKPEYGWTAELGFKQNFPTKSQVYHASFDLALFWQEYKDLVEYQVTFEGGVGLQPTNLPTARIAGYEVNLKQSVRTDNHDFSLDFGYTYAFPVQLAGLEGSQYNNVGTYIKDLFRYAGKIGNTPASVQRTAILKYRNRHLVNANVEYSNDFFNIGLYGRYYSNLENGDFEFDNGTVSIIPGISDYWQNKFPEGDFVLDLNVGFMVAPKHRIGMTVKNLTNREYSLRLSKIEAPRSFVWQYQFTF
jgi:outer membrane receptor protein involved in Fe transport